MPERVEAVPAARSIPLGRLEPKRLAANGSTKMVDQSSWSEDPSSVGQEFLDIYLKQP